MSIIVDEVSEVLDVAASQIEPPPSFGMAVDISFILGMGKVGQKVILLLDADRILMPGELEAIGHGKSEALEYGGAPPPYPGGKIEA
ncbi:MAG: chemotaxis protein CheW, partial [Fibrobacteria bacterium]